LRAHNAFNSAGVFANEPSGHAANNGSNAGTAVAFIIFGPTNDALIRRDLKEGKIASAGIAVQIFNLDDFHRSHPIA
jgi:hypothetical protein